ncbi:hypothetical protein ACNKHW_00375 [Shigella flexneri]
MAEGILPFIEDNFATLMTGQLGLFEQKKEFARFHLMRDECFAIQYHSALSIPGPE